jgi:ribose/xylose/arabinose/galactoside ABC-type transport system permease subunit
MRFWKIWDKAGIYILALTVFLAFWIIIGPNYVTVFNLSNVLLQVSVKAIGGAAMVLAITSGGFDLSVGATLTLTTVVVSMALKFWNMSIPVAILLALVIGAACGLMNGLIITKLKIQTFVATLATMLIIRGIAFLLYGGKKITINTYMNFKLLTSTKLFGFSAACWAMLLIVFFSWFLYKHTRFGVYVRGIGSNETAMRISGAKVDRTIILIFVFTALTAVISGVIQTSQTLVGNANSGESYAMECITATILGGTSLSGGKGNITGMLFAALILGFISNGLNILNVAYYYQYLATGIILIFALFMSGIKEIMQERNS